MARKKKRTAGEGSIFQDNRGYWNVQIPNGYRNGHMVYQRIRSKTLPGLHEKRRAFEQDRARGLLVNDRSPRLKDFLLQWLEHAVKIRNSYGTHRNYQNAVTQYLIPHLGRHKLEDLRRVHVQAMVNDLLLCLEPSTIHGIHATLRRALNVAEMDGYITRNVARHVDLPKITKKSVATFSPAQARIFLQAMENERLKAFYWTALLLGLRKGELCGLRLVDLSFQDGTITPTYAAQWQHKKLVLSELKTVGSHAPIMLPSSLVPVLQEHLAHLHEERAGAGWCE